MLGRRLACITVGFWRSGALWGLCGLFCVWFPLGKIYLWCLKISLRFFSYFNGLLKQNSAVIFVAFFLLCFLLCCFVVFVLFSVLLSLSYVRIYFKEVVGWCSALSLRFFPFSWPSYLHNSCVVMCMFVGLSLGFSCARFGLLLPFYSLCCFGVLLLGSKCPYVYLVCPPVITNLPCAPSTNLVFSLGAFLFGRVSTTDYGASVVFVTSFPLPNPHQ